MKTLNPLLVARKQVTKTPSNIGTRIRGASRKSTVRRLSTVRRGRAVSTVRARAFERPCATGAYRTRRSENHASSIVVIASRALPMAPAVVPSILAPKPTVARSTIVAAKLIPRICLVLLTDWSVVMRRRLCAVKMSVVASIANGTA